MDSGELVAWTNDTTPPSDTLVGDGYNVKSGDTSKRAVADVMLHGTGQCDWRDARKGICHLDDRMRRTERLTAFPSVASWTCPRNTTSWRRINNGSTAGEHFVEVILSENALIKAAALLCTTKGGGGSGKYQYQSGFGVAYSHGTGQVFSVSGPPLICIARSEATKSSCSLLLFPFLPVLSN